MTIKPQVALETLASILQRASMNQLEVIGAQNCIDTLAARLKQADELEAPKPDEAKKE